MQQGYDSEEGVFYDDDYTDSFDRDGCVGHRGAMYAGYW
jgi:hypothetical protein